MKVIAIFSLILCMGTSAAVAGGSTHLQLRLRFLLFSSMAEDVGKALRLASVAIWKLEPERSIVINSAICSTSQKRPHRFRYGKVLTV